MWVAGYNNNTLIKLETGNNNKINILPRRSGGEVFALNIDGIGVALMPGVGSVSFEFFEIVPKMEGEDIIVRPVIEVDYKGTIYSLRGVQSRNRTHAP